MESDSLTISHQPEPGAHTMDVNCWCKPKRERFVVTGQNGDGEDQGYWEVWNYESEEWGPEVDGKEEG